MEKKELGVGQYVSTGTLFVKSRISPEVTKMSLTDHAKAAVLEYLTESDEFHKLVCDITGVERKQTKVSPELEKLKEDYSHMCESYEHEKQQRNDLIRKWREETAKRLDAERERDCAQRHHKFVMDELSSMLKEVECISVRGVVDSLKAERANEKMLAEENEMCRRENDKLKLNYEKTNKELEAQKDLVKKYVAKSEKMRRLSISGKGTFVPEEGEIFLAEVPNKGIDRKVKALVSKDREACEKCCFCDGELGFLCWGVRCTTIDDETQLTFRRVSDGKI